MKIIVMKFGGTSVADINHIKNVASIISNNFKKYKLVVILSAMAGVTNNLQKLIDQGVIDENTSKEELKKILDQMKLAQGPNYYNDDGVPIEQEEEILTPFDLKGEGVPIGPMVKEPETVKPSWMTEEEWLNFQ